MEKTPAMVRARMERRNVAEMTRLDAQLTDVATDMAVPLTEAGKISLRINQVTGPKPKEYAAT